MFACEQGQIDVVLNLLKVMSYMKTCIHTECLGLGRHCHNMTALINASEKGHTEMVLNLLKPGATAQSRWTFD